MADHMNRSNFDKLHAQDGQSPANPFHFDIHTHRQHGMGIALILLTSLILYRFWQYKKSYLDLPRAGVPPGILGPWKAAFRYFTHSREHIMEGYQKYAPQGQPFLVATLPRYLVILTDPAHLEELRKASDKELSLGAAFQTILKIKIVLRENTSQTRTANQIALIRELLTQRLDYILPELHDEISLAWRDLVSIGDDWTRVNIYNVLAPVVARTANRIFVGAPLCRNQEYLEIAGQFAKAYVNAGAAADHLPWFLRHAAAWYIFKRHRLVERAAKLVGPIVSERRRKEKEFGEERWQMEKPNDCIQYMLDQASDETQKTPHLIAVRLLSLTFASIHTTSTAITNVMYDLATYTEYQQPLRDEIISMLGSFGGYTKESLKAMKKVDSVLKESVRYNSSGLAPLRASLCDFTFKSGKVPFTIPKGTIVCGSGIGIHHSEEVYGPDALEWKGFRFSDIRSKDEEGGDKYQMVSTSPSFLSFGLGKHACPGRFFAVALLKTLLSYILLKYDFKLTPEWGGKRPPKGLVFGLSRVNSEVELELRKRDDWKSMEAKMANWLKANVE